MRGVKYFHDAKGVRYANSLPYYQAVEPDGETVDKNGKLWPSYAVWKNKQTCQELFPNYEIGEYFGDDIEKPLFVD